MERITTLNPWVAIIGLIVAVLIVVGGFFFVIQGGAGVRNYAQTLWSGSRWVVGNVLIASGNLLRWVGTQIAPQRRRRT